MGVIVFDAAQAGAVNQRAFHLDLRCLARVPPSAAWFPAWRNAGNGIIAIADSALQKRIFVEAARLMRSKPKIVETRGIGSD